MCGVIGVIDPQSGETRGAAAAFDAFRGLLALQHRGQDAAGILSYDGATRMFVCEKDLGLGVPMMRAIDKGLVNSRVGIVLVTPAMLRRLPAEGIADKELSALLRRERLVPVVHGTTYEELEQVSLLLASRAGLSTAEESMAEVATKIAELVAI